MNGAIFPSPRINSENKAERTYKRPQTVLKHALEWLSDKDNWTIGKRYEFGTDRTCALGAIERFSDDGVVRLQAEELLGEVSHDLFGDGIVEVNDGGGKRTTLRWKKVLKVFEKAVTRKASPGSKRLKAAG